MRVLSIYQKRPRPSRILRTYRHLAQTVHFCDDCCHDILPGDFYEGTVILNPDNQYRILVLKKHDECPVDPDEEHYRIMKELGLLESKLDDSNKQDNSSKAA